MAVNVNVNYKWINKHSAPCTNIPRNPDPCSMPASIPPIFTTCPLSLQISNKFQQIIGKSLAFTTKIIAGAGLARGRMNTCSNFGRDFVKGAVLSF
jgi:hypothetical protein